VERTDDQKSKGRERVHTEKKCPDGVEGAERERRIRPRRKRGDRQSGRNWVSIHHKKCGGRDVTEVNGGSGGSVQPSQ